MLAISLRPKTIRLLVLLGAAACAPTQTVVGRAPENTTRETPRATGSASESRKNSYARRQNEADVGGPRVVEVDAAGNRIGTAATKRFHRSGCEKLAGVPTAEQVRFISSYDALDNGYRPCEDCQPIR